MSNNRPYGLYFSHGVDAIDPVSAAWVLKAFEWYAAGDGMHVIARRMRNGAPTQTWLSTRIGSDGLRIPKNKSVKNWDSSRISKLLRLEAYRGKIVSLEVFNVVQDRLAKAPSNGNERKYEYPLSGAMTCSQCGRHLHGGTSSATRSKRSRDGTLRTYSRVPQRYYRCVVCHYSLRADSLESAFFRDITNLTAESAMLERWITPTNLCGSEIASLKKELKQLEILNDPKRLSRRRDKLFNLALAASISSSDFELQMERLENETKERAARCSDLTKQLAADETRKRSLQHASLLLARFTEIYARAEYREKRALLSSLVLALGGLDVSRAGIHWRRPLHDSLKSTHGLIT